MLIGNRVCVKSSGLANARPPGGAKFANAPPPGTDKAGKCLAVAWGGEGGLGAAGIDCINSG